MQVAKHDGDQPPLCISFFVDITRLEFHDTKTEEFEKLVRFEKDHSLLRVCIRRE